MDAERKTLADIRSAHQDADRLFQASEVESALDRMAARITATLSEANPVFLCVMIGGIVPTGRLLTRLRFPLELDYVHATRYRRTTAGGDIEWIKEPGNIIRDRTVVVVDDVLDEGVTLDAIVQRCKDKRAAQVLTAVLVEKQLAARPGLVTADFTGLHAEDRYLFGCGMDYHGYLRNLDGIYALKKS